MVLREEDDFACCHAVVFKVYCAVYTVVEKIKADRKGRKAATYFENPPPPICCTNSYPVHYQIRSERTFHSIESSMCSPTTFGNFEVMVVQSRMGKKTKTR